MPGACSVTALYRSCVDSTGQVVTPDGTGTVVLPFTNRTSAPRALAASARAKPILPEESLLMKRTGSRRSRVAPAVTITRRPLRSSFAVSSRVISARMASGSLIRPAPVSPQARYPPSGPTKTTPRSRRTAALCCVAGAVHMPVFMAGARRIGALVARTVVDSMSSAIPQAILAMMLAVAGAMTNRSAAFASAMCSTSQVSGRANVSVTTGWLERVSKVSGATNSVAFLVMMTWTAAPALRKADVSAQAL